MKIIIILFATILHASTGSIIGEVIDADTHQPLIGANVIIVGTDFGSACDMDGKFSIYNIAVGSYTVTISMIGYSEISRANVNIYSQRQTALKFYLNPAAIEGDLVRVRAGFFEQAKDGIVSTQTMDIEEIRSDPSGIYDIQKMLQALPAVSISADQNNEIIVRGGGPGENLFVLDHLEIPNPNHFGKESSGGGAVSILNTEFVERIDFYAGGFPARYGDKQSSVMDINLREGSYDQFFMDMEVSMAGVGLFAEGPMANGKASYMTSFRQSFLKYIIKSTGMVAIPEYWNSQTKVVYNMDSRNKLLFNAVGGADNIKIEDENNPLLDGLENVDGKGYQYTGGLTYKSLFSKKGYSIISFGRTSKNWYANAYRYENELKDYFFNRDNTETDNFLKGDVVYKISPNLEISSGINCKYGEYSLNEIGDADTVFYHEYADLAVDATIDDYYELMESNPEYENFIEYYLPEQGLGSINPERINKQDGSLMKNSIHGQIKVHWDKFLVTIGLRHDIVPYNKTSVLAPRLGFSYSISPITKFNLAYGKFYQAPDYWMLMNPSNESPLKHVYTQQQVIGLEHYFAADIKGTMEIYNKTYHNKPVSIADVTPDLLDERMGFNDLGEGRSHGVELFFQKKFADKWYGTFSYSLSKSEGKDPREDREEYYPWDFDYGNVMTMIGGYKFKFRDSKWYPRFRETFIFPYISWLPFMVSDQLEVSFRYSYSGGKPYTPKNYDFRHRRWYVDPTDDLNTARHEYYSRLDIMILRRFNFNKINITTFLDIHNILDRNNIWEVMYLEDGSIDMAYHYKQMPVGGIIIEF